jgi:hypothetical protein
MGLIRDLLIIGKEAIKGVFLKSCIKGAISVLGAKIVKSILILPKPSQKMKPTR